MSKQVITVGSLFSGIGGIELGLERAEHPKYRFQTVYQVENDPYAQRVLARHWPDCGRWDDVRTFPPAPAEDWRVDLICGGFPCQDISKAGNRAGIDGKRSGLWSHYIRTVRTLRPSFIIVENVAALLDRGIGRVLGDLDASGYVCEWECLPAGAFGAYHLRDRLFIVANSHGERSLHSETGRQPTEAGLQAFGNACPGCSSGRLHGSSKGKWQIGNHRWISEPDLDRVVNGLPSELDANRIRCLGNAVVPQVATWVGERILEAIAREDESG